MMRPRVLGAGVGVIASLATAALLALEAIVAQGFWTLDSPVKYAAVVAAAFQALMLIILTILIATCLGRVTEFGARKNNGVWFAMGLMASLLSSAASAVMLALMGKAEDSPKTLAQIPSGNCLIGSSIALVAAFVAQLIFIVVYFVVHRLPDSEQALSLHTNEDCSRSPAVHVKSIPYSRTTPATSQINMNKERSLFNGSSRPGSSSGRSMAETMSSIRTSLSHSVRPSGSKTRLLSTSSRTRRRPASIDSNSYRERPSVTEDSFDSWDTSSVDPQNRQIVVDTTSPPLRARFLETIPASPTTSRSPSPGCPLDLVPPKRNRRSRSYSPLPRAQQHERSLTPQSSPGESHIHPLFRSDSPAPPAATPGTMVIAAPNAGQTISEKSLTRMRSGSLPTGPGPLSRQGSYDSFRKSPSPNPELLHAEELAGERKMTPPIPEWILSAGSTTSLAEYQARRLREQSSAEDMGSVHS
ncbi:uncharacterized protein F4822DRAFT_29910 [Hypoxylon trugodes]|uniref:uncharacterized protein n=1 Tax=Hypoxylon trugodes TaxID=326681 RepID=UPI0021A13077|nr:uncharacterized protein F4822DRAFT_29910 [Hypoxylon trugodes]KAI1393920.1 hypothetical protein F4822DRAFT_29910 [Hypoxylon trugodes]